MITAVCLNPCIDKTVKIASFNYGGMNRIIDARADASGKGVNVAIVARQLGMESTCIGYLYHGNGTLVQKRLDDCGAMSDFIWADGEVRTNLKVLDMATGKITEINEAGIATTSAQMANMVEMVKKHSKTSDFMVFTGSLPPNCPTNFYKTLIEAVDDRCKSVLDAEGAKLTYGVMAKPFLIKPNLYELEMEVGRELKTLNDIKVAAITYIEKGVNIVAVSMGSDGAFITDGVNSYYAPCIKVDVKSTVGAGDSMVTGLMKGFISGMSLKDSFISGVACATSSVTTDGTQLVNVPTYEKLLPVVTVQDV